MTTMSVRAMIPAVVAAALLTGCGFLDQSSDQDIFANADLSTTVDDQTGLTEKSELTTPPAEVEPQPRPALRVNVDEDNPALAMEPADQTDNTPGAGPSTSTAVRTTTQSTLGRGTMTTAAGATTTGAPTTQRTTTTAAPTTRATTTTAAPSTKPTATTSAPTTKRTTATAAPNTPGGQNSFPTSNVVRLSDGQTVTFKSQVAPGGTPVLAWLWAPG
jgi:hypothetical protein